MRQVRHRVMRCCSWLPHPVLMFGMRHWPWTDDDGWNFWLDASYWQYCRRDRKATGG